MAQSKYEVGPIENCEPVKITPKSTRGKTTATKKKLLMLLVLILKKSLLDTGVIIPVKTQQFELSYEKDQIRTTGLQEEWCFV